MPNTKVEARGDTNQHRDRDVDIGEVHGAIAIEEQRVA
jgi:hypothetical protein